VLGVERIRFGALQVEHADQAILQQQGTTSSERVSCPISHLNVARILRSVSLNAQDAALAGGRAGESGVQRDGQARRMVSP
jgi:hypothetical protein